MSLISPQEMLAQLRRGGGETVDRVARAIVVHVAGKDAFGDDLEIIPKGARQEARDIARAAIEALKEPDPMVVARAADRLGIPPTEVAKVAGMWLVVVEEMLGGAK